MTGAASASRELPRAGLRSDKREQIVRRDSVQGDERHAVHEERERQRQQQRLVPHREEDERGGGRGEQPFAATRRTCGLRRSRGVIHTSERRRNSSVSDLEKAVSRGGSRMDPAPPPQPP